VWSTEDRPVLIFAVLTMTTDLVTNTRCDLHRQKMQDYHCTCTRLGSHSYAAELQTSSSEPARSELRDRHSRSPSDHAELGMVFHREIYTGSVSHRYTVNSLVNPQGLFDSLASIRNCRLIRTWRLLEQWPNVPPMQTEFIINIYIIIFSICFITHNRQFFFRHFNTNNAQNGIAKLLVANSTLLIRDRHLFKHDFGTSASIGD